MNTMPTAVNHEFLALCVQSSEHTYTTRAHAHRHKYIYMYIYLRVDTCVHNTMRYYYYRVLLYAAS